MISQKKINLGCGLRFHNDWINVDFIKTGADVIVCDLTKGIPFPDNEFDVVYHSHILEHFAKDKAPLFLKECYRVLKLGGIIRIAVPDIEQIIKEYTINLNNALKNESIYKYDWIMIELFDQFSRRSSGGMMREFIKNAGEDELDYIYKRIGQEASLIRKSNLIELKRPFYKKIKSAFSYGKWNDLFLKIILSRKNYQMFELGKFVSSGENHLWMYDRYSMKRLLENVGFKNITIKKTTESEIKLWNSYCLDADENGVPHKPDSLYIEAIK